MNAKIDLLRGFKSSLLWALVGFAIPLGIVLASASTDTPDGSKFDWGMPAALGITFVGSIFAFAAAGFVSSAPSRGVTFPVCLSWIGGMTFATNLMLPPPVPTFDGIEPTWSLIDLVPYAVFLISTAGLLFYGIRKSTSQPTQLDRDQQSGQQRVGPKPL